MGKYLGIVLIEKHWGLSLMLQDYTDCYYLRVENSEGAEMLECQLSSNGKLLSTSEQKPEGDKDLRCVQWTRNAIAVKWAQNAIAKHTS